MKRILKFIGCFALAFAGAGSVQAAPVTTEVELNAALGAGGDVKLGADIVSAAKITISVNCVLDLNGFSISGSRETGLEVSCSDFKLINSNSEKAGAVRFENYKDFSGKDGAGAFSVKAGAKATFGDVNGENSNFSVFGSYRGANVSGTIVINGGEFGSKIQGKSAEGALSLHSGCVVAFNGGSVSSIAGLDSANVTVGAGKALACLTSGSSMQLCDIPAEGLDLSYGQVIIGVANGQTYKVKQSSAAENKNQLKICAAENTTATVVLDGLCCNNSDTIVCESGEGSAIVLELDNASTLTGGIRNVGEGELVIQDENGTAGSIKITASGYCAAIGGNQVLSPVGKNITIKSGTIECEAGYGAAIGGGGSTGGNAVNIKILGGTVTAKSDRGAAIGGGNEGYAENIIISGGTVVASSDRGKAVGDGFQSSGSTGISISCGTYSPKPAADMIADGYEAIEKDEKFVIGVKISDSTIVTTGTQETTVEVPAGVEITPEVKEKIEQGTKVEGVKLTAVAESSEKKSGLEAVLAAAKEDDDFAKVAEKASEIIVKVDVLVKPAESPVSTKVLFKLEPKATVSVDTGDGIKTKEVPVTNDMIDKNQKVSVSIYTGFKPAAIVHDDDDGVRIETFSSDQIAYDEVSGVATVQIGHFSFLGGYLDLADVPVPPVAKVGEDKYTSLADAVNAADDGETVVLLQDVTIGNVEFSKNLEIDFNGKKVTCLYAGAFYSESNNVTLKFKNGAAAAATVNFKGNFVVFVGNAQKVVFGDNITYVAEPDQYASFCNCQGSNAEAVVNGGTFEWETKQTVFDSFKKVTFNGGSFKTYGHVVKGLSSIATVVDVHAGTFVQLADPQVNFDIKSMFLSVKELTVDETVGTVAITTPKALNTKANAMYTTKCTDTLKGGEYKIGNFTDDTGKASGTEYHLVIIEGGRYDVGKFGSNSAGYTPYVMVKAGTFKEPINGTGANVEHYEGSVSITNDDGSVTYSVQPVAKIGEKEYETFAEAFAAANEGDVVEMLRKCERTSTLTIDKSITLKTKDLVVAATAGAGLALAGGAKVTLDITGDDNAFTGAAGFAGINVPDGTELTITGTGKMAANGGTGAEAIGAGQGSTNAQKIIDTGSGALIVLKGDAPTTMKVAEGAKGSIKVPQGAAAAVLVPADESKLPVTVSAVGSDKTIELTPEIFLPAVASLTHTVGEQPVVTRYASLKEAYDATVDGDTITILADFDLTEAFQIGTVGRDNLVIDLNEKTMTLNAGVGTWKKLTFANGDIVVGEKAGVKIGEHSWTKLFYAESVNAELKFDHVELTYTNGVSAVGIANGGNAKLTFKDSILNFANSDKPLDLGSMGDVVFDHTIVNADNTTSWIVAGADASNGPVIFKGDSIVTMRNCGGLTQNASMLEMSNATVNAFNIRNPLFRSSSGALLHNARIFIDGATNMHGFNDKELVVNAGCTFDVRNCGYLGATFTDGTMFKSGSTVVISNCCITTDESKSYYGQDEAVWAKGNLTIEKGADVTISGKLVAYSGSGTISIADGRYQELVSKAENLKFNITGGVYKQEPAKEFIDPWYEAVPNTGAETKAEGYAWMIAKKVPQIVTEPKDPEAIAAAAKVVDGSGNEVNKESLMPAQHEKIAQLAGEVAAAQASTVSALTFVETEIDKSVMNPPTSPDAKPTVKPTIVNGLKDTAINEKHLPEDVVNAQITTDSDVNHYIDVDITTPEMKLVSDNISLKALTYDVKPMVKTIVITKDGDNDVTNVVERQLANSEIVKALKFRMPLTEEFVGKNIKVTHSKDSEGLDPVEGSWRTRVYPVKGSGNDVYVEAESDVFSYFKNELTTDNPTQVEVWTGGVWTAVSSLGEAASAASDATVNHHETGVIIRLVANQTEGCTLPLNVTLQTNGHAIGTVTAEGGFTLTLDENGVYRCIDFGVSDVKVKQRYPWNGLVDISYTLSDSLPSGYDLIVTLEDKSNVQIKYMATTFLAPPTFNKGVNTVVWNAFADLNGLVLRNFKCTIEVKKRLN